MGRHHKIGGAGLSEMPSDVLATLQEGLLEAFGAVRTAIQAGDVAPQLVREMSGAARSITAIQAELRAREKARAYTLKTLPRALVLGWLREQSADEREKVMREVQAMNAGGSVLG